MIGGRITRRLLRRHVRRRPDRRADLRHRGGLIRTHLRPRRADGLRNAKVRDDGRFTGEQHVVGLDVAVHDAALVRIHQRARDVAQNAHRFVLRKRPARQSAAQRLAFDKRHRIVRRPVDLSGREHRHDVRLLQRGGELDLPLEPARAQRRRKLGREDFDDDLAAQLLLGGHEDARHAAAAKLTLDGIVGIQ